MFRFEYILMYRYIFKMHQLVSFWLNNSHFVLYELF